MTGIRVLVADDHAIVRQGLRLVIDGERDMTVVGEAANGREAAQQVCSLAPDVVVMDVSMPEMNGLAATQEIRRASPATAVVALTRFSDDAYVAELIRAGVLAYVLKQSPTAELLKAIRSAASGRPYLDHAIQQRHHDEEARRLEMRATITDREAEVLRLMALGHSNKEIANTLDLSVKTVEVHRANSMRKLGLTGRIDIVRYALLQGWLQDP